MEAIYLGLSLSLYLINSLYEPCGDDLLMLSLSSPPERRERREREGRERGEIDERARGER